jgi:hypothetical protein
MTCWRYRTRNPINDPKPRVTSLLFHISEKRQVMSVLWCHCIRDACTCLNTKQSAVYMMTPLTALVKYSADGIHRHALTFQCAF